MRYAASLTLLSALGLAACQLTINGKNANDPNAANAATSATGAATGTPAATTPATAATPGVAVTRIHRPSGMPADPNAGGNAGGGTANAGNTGAGAGGATTSGGNLPAPVVQGGNDFGNGTATTDSLTGQVYFIPENTQKFPDVSQIRPTAVLYTKQLNIAPRSFEAGFPGVDKRYEWFAVRYNGNITVTQAGAWKFRTLCDDGCNIYIDGAKVLDNDGIHPPTNHVETINLTAGPHTIQVDDFQGPKYDIALQFWVTPPGGAERLFTTTL